ncbi:unnamed protein product [Meganyctiphanes norvegica]|uniref:C2H2-type domain-containing protein n=1 Tax=Meganyctiphanes norvegica TaxID=48144 RepID=A0AAV2R6H5_MEGNR
MTYGEKEELLTLDVKTDDANRYVILKDSEHKLSYSKWKFLKRRNPKKEEYLNDKIMSNKKQRRLSNEGSLGNGIPDEIEDISKLQNTSMLELTLHHKNGILSNCKSRNTSKNEKKNKEETLCNLENSKIYNENKSNNILHNKLNCEICKNKFKTKELLNEHMDAHRSKKYNCSRCGQQFKKISEVAIHMHMHAHREKWDNPKMKYENNSNELINKRKSVTFSDEVQARCSNGSPNFVNTVEQTKFNHSERNNLIPGKFHNIEKTSLPLKKKEESVNIVKLETENNSLETTRVIKTEPTVIKKEKGNFECGWCNFSCETYKLLLQHRHTHSKEYQRKKNNDDNTFNLMSKIEQKKNIEQNYNNSSINKTNNENNHELVEKSNSNKREFETGSKSVKEPRTHKICKSDGKYPTSQDISKFNKKRKNGYTKESNGLPLDNQIMHVSNGDIEDNNNSNSKLYNGHLYKILAESEMNHSPSKENDEMASFIDTKLSQSNSEKNVPSTEIINKSVNNKGETTLIRACMLSKEKEVRKLLTIPGININKTDYAGWTALHEAAHKGNIEIIKMLLDYQPKASDCSQISEGSCDITKKGANGMTALHESVAEGDIETVKVLLEYGGNTLLMMESSGGKLACNMTTNIEMLTLLKSFEGTKGKFVDR